MGITGELASAQSCGPLRARHGVPAGSAGIDAALRETRNKLAAAAKAAGTSLTEVFGVGTVIAGTVIGGARDVRRFPGRAHFAAYDGTAPVEVSSGQRKIYRLSRRGNRRLNHVIHMAAVTQVRYRHSDGRAYYDKKIAGGKTRKEALRALKRRISDAIYTRLRPAPGGPRPGPRQASPGGQRGNDSITSAVGSHPQHRLFGQATPGPATTLRSQRLRPETPLLLPFPLRRHPARAGSRVKGRAEPGRRSRRPQGVLDAAAREPIMAPAGKRDHPHPGGGCRAEAPLAHHISALSLTLKQRGVRSGRLRGQVRAAG